MNSIFLLISLSLAFFISCQADLIGDICSQALNPGLCNNSLRSDPRSNGASLLTLAQIAVDKSISATSTVVTVAQSLAGGSLKQKAETCVETCNEAIGILNQCKSLLSSGGSSANLPTKVNTAFGDIGICDHQFGREVIEPPQLQKANYQAMGLVNVAFIIVKRLQVDI